MIKMINDSERRAVAARMREIMRDNPDGWLDITVSRAVADVLWDGVLGDGVKIGETVADLIDRPTCEMTREGEGFRCSACGTFHDMSGFEKFPWPYCPNCSAEVV